MAQHYFDNQTVTTTGVKAPNSLTKWPEFGGTAQVAVSGGTATATVELRAWNISGAKETLAQFVLPVASGAKAGNLFDSVVVASQWENWDWNVLALGAGASLQLTLSGSGI
jgi:hypothetical protein